ncbi:protein POLYCHOME [Humulus lupulus]|uniref:protein POLYCHOME n=1 Tax=Humulus lupulus TaxID=3486 RepID=UPI002B40D9A2|nr:protein POLYCHOME [Humulus lupulus]XP_062117613.1 protein POLYCHOME [Humulus lupulus]
MPESRDRLSRPVDVAGIFSQRRANSLGVLVDEPELGPTVIGPPTLQTTTTTTTDLGTTTGFGATREGGGLRRDSFGTPRAGPWRRESTPMTGTSRRGWGRGRNRHTLLPSWYPRTPLRDITAIVRAIERRRASLRDAAGSGLEIGSPTPQELGSFASSSVDVAPLDYNLYTTTPRSVVRRKPCPPSVSSVGKVPKILLGIANQTTGESDCLTPQKKLLNSIDTVEKVVMEELHKLKRTPTAKRAEREKRVRTLMTMR